MLPYTLNFFVELNVPIPEFEAGVNPVCFHNILFPALIVGVDVPAVNVCHVTPSSKLYCKLFFVNENVPRCHFSSFAFIKYL